MKVASIGPMALSVVPDDVELEELIKDEPPIQETKATVDAKTQEENYQESDKPSLVHLQEYVREKKNKIALGKKRRRERVIAAYQKQVDCVSYVELKGFTFNETA